MEKTIHTLELERWSKPDELHRVKFLGMVKAQTAFDKLKAHLEANKLLPDEYFLFNADNFKDNNEELPNFSTAVCNTSFGGSEGIYIDISLFSNSVHNNKISFATGKTLKEGIESFYHMSRIAAECSIMLNSGGATFTIEEPPAITYRLNDKEQTFYTIIEKRGSDALLKRNIDNRSGDPTPYIVASNVNITDGFINWGSGRYCESIECAVKLFSDVTIGEKVDKSATLEDLLASAKQENKNFSRQLFNNMEQRKSKADDLSL